MTPGVGMPPPHVVYITQRTAADEARQRYLYELLKKMTSRFTEMRNERPTFVLGHLKFFRNTRKAQKFLCPAIDQLFGQTDLIRLERSAADLTCIHQTRTIFARKILQP